MTHCPMGCWNVRGFNSLDRVLACKKLVSVHHLDLLCILEAKVPLGSVSDYWFINSHKIFADEDSCNNFGCSNPGRIWVKWNSRTISFLPLHSSSQLIHGVVNHVNSPNMPPFMLSVVYAANSPSERASLWQQLIGISPSVASPWIILGDFNCCRLAEEKSGGNPLNNGRLLEMNSWIFNTGVLELPSTGLFFTWYNQRVDDPIHIKLDRALVNAEWLDHFPSSFCKVEPPSCPDHSPLVILPGICSKVNARFQFKHYLLNLDGFWDGLVSVFAAQNSGSPISAFYSKLHNLKNFIKSKKWSNSSYISSKIKELSSAQAHYMALLQHSPLDQNLNDTIHNINSSLSCLHKSWSSWLIQRAKADWLTRGEDDLGFLFARIKARKSFCRINELSTMDGHFSDPGSIAAAAVDCHCGCGLLSAITIPPHLVASLTASVTDLEIQNVVFSTSNSKAPGPDWFTFEFYTDSWNLIGNQVCKAIKHFFSTGFLLRSAKATATALIPKGSHANNILDYRPTKQCGKKYFCAKLDIQKAFDTVSREFLLYRLAKKGFSPLFVDWIKGCIEDVYFSVVINGGLEGFFPSSSGLRQGCPLSPMLFSVVMDAFSCALNASNFIGISLNGFLVNHLLYADDILVFGEASLDNATILNNVLSSFDMESGLAVNYSKCSILFSSHTPLANEITQLLGFSPTANPLTYLGLPISPKKLKAAHFQPLLSRISTLLDGWKVKFLSFAGRI
ncbi:uncharacterized protein LOC110105699 [Dendrobium catenatum]|uniref:uncharacterized protein LOC110105699 n=1 Tax=Dendrobium catenatum TaxID=906689 RepID=UPI0010A07B1B|nr:uncharacterized protein LOC110105699 [Dendrobium catenatum]